MSDIKPEDYSCEILLEKTTPEKAKNTSFPTDAYNVTYTVDGEDKLDVCRAQKAANIFDLLVCHSSLTSYSFTFFLWWWFKTKTIWWNSS